MKNVMLSSRLIRIAWYSVSLIIGITFISVISSPKAFAFVDGGIVIGTDVWDGRLDSEVTVGGVYLISAFALAGRDIDFDPRVGVKPRVAMSKVADALASQNGAVAVSVAQINFIPARRGLIVNSLGSFAQAIDDVPPVGTLAAFLVADPVIFSTEGVGFTMFTGSYGLGAGFGLSASGNAKSRYSFSMESNQPGYESLFSLNISLNGTGLSSLAIDFNSNPLLGLSDTMIENLIQTSLLAGNGFLTSDLLNIVQFEIPNVPLGQDFVLDTAWVGSVATTPEPSTVLLLSVALIPFIRKRKWRNPAA